MTTCLNCLKMTIPMNGHNIGISGERIKCLVYQDYDSYDDMEKKPFLAFVEMALLFSICKITFLHLLSFGWRWSIYWQQFWNNTINRDKKY